MKQVPLLAALLLVAAPSVAASGESLTIKGSGEGDWSLWCDVQPARGDVTKVELRRDRASFSSPAARSAECHLSHKASGPLTLSIEGETWQCPFPAVADGQCSATFLKGATNDFRVRPKQ